MSGDENDEVTQQLTYVKLPLAFAKLQKQLGLLTTRHTFIGHVENLPRDMGNSAQPS